MLYDRWQQIARDRRSDLALVELKTGRRWTFAQLADSAGTGGKLKAPHGPAGVAHPSGVGAEFVLQTLAAWRQGQVLCPVEAGATPPRLTAAPTGVAHLKLTSATTGEAPTVALTAEQLAADATHIVSTMCLLPDWPKLGVISLAPSYGFSNLVLPLLLHGIPLYLLDAPLPESVRRAAQEIGPMTLPALPALWRAWHEAGVLSSSIRLAVS